MTVASVPGGTDRALKDHAHELVRRGKLEAAADVYLLLIAKNPKEPSLRIHHAELCDKLNRKERAVASYQLAAHLLASAGHAARARAALGCALRISPFDPGLRRALNELSPRPQLSLVRPAVPFEEPVEELLAVAPDEAVTEPFEIPVDELEAYVECEAPAVPGENQPVPIDKKTVCQRPPGWSLVSVGGTRR